MGTLGAIRKELNNAANDLIKTKLLNRLPAELKTRMRAAGGDIVPNIEDNTYTVIGCSEALSKEIMEALKVK
jgi:chromosome condensin MukBEF complex kleisin-like MukF subunit